MGATRAPPLSKICDIAELVRGDQSVEWRWVIQEASRRGALRILYLGLRTAADLFGIAFPKDIWQKSDAFPQINSLATHVRERVLGGNDNGYSRPELLNGSLWYSEVRERLRDKNKVVRFFVRAIAPDGNDYSFVRLPRALFSLYYVVRPIRLLGKYGRILLSQIRGKSRT